MAVDKPAGMSVHNAPGEDLCSQISGLLREEDGVEATFGVNPVHRLDKETSGIILLAYRRDSFRFLSRQFEAGEAKKLYLALLHGHLAVPEGAEDALVWKWVLSKTAGGRENPKGPNPRLPSETRCRVLDHSVHYTLAEIEPLTGRTHQIRRHAKLAGHPVVGDARYGSTRAIAFLKQNAGFDRLALHAQAITLRLPGGDAPVTLKTSGLPDRMRELFEKDQEKGTEA